ncbi:hypothetical protein NEUTE2DRAFT_129227 [Neurospora tetrasperma FGSC 2509]|nr:hypothetical protein NEUTE2DRAFT_129227 [Neurospora tetrasperma FGSC 2509]
MAEVGVDQEVRNMARSAERVEMIVGNFIVSVAPSSLKFTRNFNSSPKTYRSIIICAEEGTAGTCTLVDCPERDDVEVWFPIKVPIILSSFVHCLCSVATQSSTDEPSLT